MKNIKRLISDMNITSRKHEDVFPRFYLINHIQKEFKISYTAIGKMFGKDHATIINALNKHRNFMETKDKEYKHLTTKMRRLLAEDLNILEKDIVNCTSLTELEIIQNKVRSDYYY